MKKNLEAIGMLELKLNLEFTCARDPTKLCILPKEKQQRCHICLRAFRRILGSNYFACFLETHMTLAFPAKRNTAYSVMFARRSQ